MLQDQYFNSYFVKHEKRKAGFNDMAKKVKAENLRLDNLNMFQRLVGQ